MAEHDAAGPIEWIEPRVGILMGDRSRVVMWDAREHPEVGADAEKLRSAIARSEPGVMLLRILDGSSPMRLDDLVPARDGRAEYCVLYEVYDRFLEIFWYVDAARRGDELVFQTELVQYSAPRLPHTVAPEERADWVMCGVGAFEEAVSVAQAFADETARVLRGCDEGVEDAPWESWLAHPSPWVRRRLARAPSAPSWVLRALGEDAATVEDVLHRSDAPGDVLEHIAGFGEWSTRHATLLARHPNTPTSVLEEIVHREDATSRWASGYEAATKARARLSERAIASASSLDEVFGELRAQLLVEPGANAWESLLRTLEAGRSRDARRVAEEWIPYVRSGMTGWPAFECTLPRASIDAWARGSTPPPLLGVAKRFVVDESHASPKAESWRALCEDGDSSAVVIFGVFQRPTKAALEALCDLELPAVEQVVVSSWGDERAPFRYEPRRLPEAAWLPRVRELTLSHLRLSEERLEALLERASSLESLSLRHLDLTELHASALARSGALARLRYLRLGDADVSRVVAELSTLRMPALRELDLDGSGLVDADLERMCASPWLGALEELSLCSNPGLTSLEPLLDHASSLRPDVVLDLQGCSFSRARVIDLERLLPRADVRT